MCYDGIRPSHGRLVPGYQDSYQESASRTRANEGERQARAMPGTRLFVAAFADAIDIASTFNRPLNATGSSSRRLLCWQGREWQPVQ